MEENTLKKRRNFAYILLIMASFFLYIVLTGAKNLYTAEKTTLATVFGHLDNPLTALAATMEYYFYAYALTQVALVFVMKKINIKWFLTATVGVSAVLTVLMAWTNTIYEHYMIFTVNGFMQAGLWGCTLKVLSIYLPQRLLASANMLMSSGPAVASVVAYATAAAFGDNWKTPFLMLGIILLFATVLYCLSVSYVQKFPKEDELHHVTLSDGSDSEIDLEEENDFIHLNSKLRVALFYVFSVILGFLMTGLFFMVNNNLDVFLKEIGGYSNDIAKLLTIIAPVTIVIGPILIVRLCEKWKNFIFVSFMFFAFSLLFSLMMLILFNRSVIATLFMFLGFLILTNGGRSVSISIAGLRMRKKIDTGVYTTLVNASASIAAGITPKIITRILDNTAYSTEESWAISFKLILIGGIIIAAMLLAVILWINIANKKLDKASL